MRVDPGERQRQEIFLYDRKVCESLNSSEEPFTLFRVEQNRERERERERERRREGKRYRETGREREKMREKEGYFQL